MQRDIQERDLVRLGAGERDLDTDSDFSKWGRVTASLELRMSVLAEVDRLGSSMSVTGDVGYTCETAMNFFRFHVQPRIADFRKKCTAAASSTTPPSPKFVAESFPFLNFFATAPGGLESIFKGVSFQQDLVAAEGCLRHLDGMLADVQRYCRMLQSGVLSFVVMVLCVQLSSV